MLRDNERVERGRTLGDSVTRGTGAGPEGKRVVVVTEGEAEAEEEDDATRERAGPPRRILGREGAGVEETAPTTSVMAENLTDLDLDLEMERTMI